MAKVETLQAKVERQLIHQMARAILICEDKEAREREIEALCILVTYVDPSLNVALIDGLTQRILQQLQLWGPLIDRRRGAGGL